MNRIAQYLITIPAVLLVIVFHELAHGVAAYKLGDPTAKRMGRLSLNPLKHLDPIGALCMVLFHFGWAKPVPVDMRYFRDPKRDMAITALAGPLCNL
ncbi:MAG: site-2 protease family protein, partial [Ruminococcaceae bacterium]|nr:site-2 protease family protein [Oscillospiraceae bacterium]